jgi:hypothetical protein
MGKNCLTYSSEQNHTRSRVYNINICRVIQIITTYKPPHLFLTTFLFTLQHLISKFSTLCPIIILGDFNVDASKTQSQQTIQLFQFMMMNKMKLEFHENITIYGSQLNHILSNTPSQQCI